MAAAVAAADLAEVFKEAASAEAGLPVDLAGDGPRWVVPWVEAFVLRWAADSCPWAAAGITDPAGTGAAVDAAV